MRTILPFLFSIALLGSTPTYAEDIFIIKAGGRSPSDTINQLSYQLHSKLPNSKIVQIGEHEPSDLASKTAKYIVLGRSGFSFAVSNLNPTSYIIAGLPFVPTGHIGAPYRIAPDTLIKSIKKANLGIAGISVIYSTPNAQYVNSLKEALAHDDLTLNAQMVNSRDKVLDSYAEFFSQPDSKQALLVLYDPMATQNGVLLPYIATNAWKYKLVTITTFPKYVKLGILLGIYPTVRSTANVIIKRLHSQSTLFPRETVLSINKKAVERRGLPLSKQSDTIVIYH
ncbi:hypothetical protein [Neptuniibacter sp. QD37_11]|uniref:hypothetical protein n=1 Tax=Neptuniibacter sp. QD37_11 TaxID=3398209 RepID=UPI0039F5B88A